MKKVTGHTRAKKDGTYIVCPLCNHSFPIFHFAWPALTCLKCKAVVDKKDWFLKDRSHKLPEVKKTVFPRVLIKVRGGNVVWVAATETIEVVTVDHDNIAAGDLETCQDIYEANAILSKWGMNAFVKKMLKKHNWVCTDTDCNQYRRTLGDNKYLFKEDRCVDPATGKTEVFEAKVDLANYLRTEIIDACRPFGYSMIQVEKWLSEKRESALIAECIFENLT